MSDRSKSVHVFRAPICIAPAVTKPLRDGEAVSQRVTTRAKDPPPVDVVEKPMHHGTGKSASGYGCDLADGFNRNGGLLTNEM